MKIILKIMSTLFLTFSVWGTEPDYNKLPIPCRYDVREFYHHTKNILLNGASITEEERKVVIFFQQAMTKLPSIKIMCPFVDNLFDKALETVEKSTPPLLEISRFKNFIKDKLYSIENNICVVFINVILDNNELEYPPSFINVKRNSLLPCALRYIIDENNNTYKKLAEKLDLEAYLSLMSEKDIKKIHKPDLDKILKFEGKGDYYDKMYQAIYPPLYTGFQAYQTYGMDRRLLALLTGVFYDMSIFLTFYSLAGIVSSVTKHNQALSHEGYTKTISHSFVQDGENDGKSQVNSSVSIWGGIASLCGRQPSTIQAIRMLNCFVPALFRVENEEKFDEAVTELALWVACKIVALEKKQQEPFTESDRRKVSAKVLSAVRMDIARSFNAGTILEAVYRLYSWNSWGFSSILEAYALQPIDLFQNELLMKKVFGEDFVNHLWDQSKGA